MSQSITLQTSDASIVSGDNIGRLSFAASSEASAGDSILIAASIYAEAEAEFTSTANSTSLVFATAASDNATGQYKITSIGHFEPFATVAQNLGSDNKKFNILYVDNIKAVSKGITLTSNTPALTTDTLYNVGGSLYFNGSPISGGTSSGTTSYDWKLSANSGATLTITSGTTVNFTGLGNITVSRNGSDIRISGSASSGGGTPGGSNTFIQYNSSGSFAGDSSLVWNYSTKELAVSGKTTLNSTGTGIVLQVKNTGTETIFSISDVDETVFLLQAQAAQSGKPFEIKDADNNYIAYIDISGNYSGNNIIFGDGTTQTTAFTGSTSSNVFDTITINTGLAPSPVTNKLYNISGELYFNGIDLHFTGTSGIQLIGSTFRMGGTGTIDQINLNTQMISSGIIRQGTERTSTGTGISLSLANNNHQTINTSGASAAVTVTLAPPSGSAAGTLIVRQHTPRNITWSTTTGTVYWMGTRPTWSGDPTGAIRLVSWRWDNTNIYLAATETGRL